MTIRITDLSGWHKYLHHFAPPTHTYHLWVTLSETWKEITKRTKEAYLQKKKQKQKKPHIHQHFLAVNIAEEVLTHLLV